jgi:ribulose-5-phosphate 4-epimerase/fuculose-1-phosphate aldolase
MMQDTLIEQCITYARKAYDRQLVSGTGGNLSVRLDEDKMVITGSGISLGDTHEENLVIVDLKDLSWKSSSNITPSKEFLFHAAILQRRVDIQAVLHVHPPYATGYAAICQDIPMMTDAAFKQPPIPRVPFAPSGTTELRDYVIAAIEANPFCKALLLEKHGLITFGHDIPGAYLYADLIEELARIASIAENLHASKSIGIYQLVKPG